MIRPSARALPAIFCLAAGVALVAWIWSFNAGCIGPFYDYSIIINNLQARSSGLVRYVDYPSVLQSGVVWLAAASEFCFGKSYHSLAIGNLILSLVTFLTAFGVLRRPIGPILATLVGLGFCAATTLQHGILWYNSLAISLIGVQCLLIASIPIERFSPFMHLWPALTLAVLSGATKINYHLLGIGFGCLLLARIFVAKSGWRKGFLLLAVVALLLLVAGPLLECALCGVSPVAWAQYVIIAPAGRARTISGFLMRDFWLGARWPYYFCTTPGVVLGVAFLFAAVIAVSRPSQTKSHTLSELATNWEGPLLLVAGWFGGALLILSNVEIQILNASFFLIAATCALLRVRQLKGNPVPWTWAVTLLALLFCCTGAWSAARHARLRYDDPTATPVPEASLRPVTEALPLLSPYFGNVRTFPSSFEKLVDLRALAEQNKIDLAHERVFWGPEFEFMNRVLDSKPPEGIPLWFQRGVTYRVSRSGRIVEAFSKANLQWFIAAGDWSSEAPPSLLTYLTNQWQMIEARPLLVFRSKTP